MKKVFLASLMVLFVAAVFSAPVLAEGMSGVAKYKSLCQEEGEGAIEGRGEFDREKAQVFVTVNMSRFPHVSATWALEGDRPSSLYGIAFATQDNGRRGTFAVSSKYGGLSVLGRYKTDKEGDLQKVKGNFTFIGNCVIKGNFKVKPTPEPAL